MHHADGRRAVVAAAATAVTLAIAGAARAVPPEFELAWSANFPGAHGPTRFALADLDGDEVLDAVFPGRGGDGLVYLYRGAGDGSFVDPISIEIGEQTDWAEIVDVDGDGVLDLLLAVRAASGSVAVLHGLGGFAFDAPVLTSVGRDPRAVAAGEFVQPGGRELFSMQNNESNVRALAPSGGGTHVAGSRRALTPWMNGPALPQWMGRGDADGNGASDLWVLTTGGGSLTIFNGPGSSLLDSSTAWRMPPAGDERPGVALGSIDDLDGDGDFDFATAGLFLGVEQSLIVLENGGGGAFDRKSVHPITYEGYAWGIATGDLDLDGDADAIVTTALPGRLHVLENVGGLQFTPVDDLAVGTFARHVWIDDLDGDCKPDLIAVDLAQNKIVVYRNVTAGVEGCGGIASGAPGPGAAGAPPRAPDARARAVSQALAARAELARSRGADAVMRVLADAEPGGRSGFVAGLGHGFDRGAPSASRTGDTRGIRGGGIGGGGRSRSGRTGERSGSGAGGDGGIAGKESPCGPPAGLCDEVHAEPGCYTTSCCLEICRIEPFCCSTAWDEGCVSLVQFYCGGLVCPSPGSCFEVRDTPGCDDAECCDIVTRLDGFCAYTIWDELCVLSAQRFCFDAPCALDAPPPASIDELEPCYEPTSQGCVAIVPEAANWIELACGAEIHGKCSTGAPRDSDWFRFEATSSGRVRFEVVTEFPARLLMIEGACEGPLRLVTDEASWNCGVLAVDACIEPGVHQFVLTVGTPELVVTGGEPCDEVDPDAPPPDPEDPPFVPGHFGLHWHASFTCSACGVPGDLNGDGFVNGADLTIILGAWGPGSEGDLNGDGVADGADITIVLGNWTG